MKKLLFLLLLSSFAFGQNKAIDTTMGNGSQLATILRLDNSKIYITQNKEKQAPYILQKNGSFISAGVPDVSVSILNSNSVKPTDFIYYKFEHDKLKDGETKEIIKNDGKPVYLKMMQKNKNTLIISSLFPMSNKILLINMSVLFTNEDDKMEKFYDMRDILEKGVLILEDYYLTRTL